MHVTFVKGQLAVLAVEKWAIENSAMVSIPTVEARYDLVLDVEGKLYRVQVKYCDKSASPTHSAISIDLRKSCRGNNKYRTYDKSEIDLVAVYTPKLKEILWFSSELLHKRKSITVRLSAAKNKQVKGTHHYKMYTLENAIKGS